MEHADTRTRIQSVAIRLFNENGYEATSLREIADEIGVTKAALYYHFKTKEEIVTSLLDDRLRALDDLLEWSRTLPRTQGSRQEIIKRYAADSFSGNSIEAMRFFDRNPTALRDRPSGTRLKEQMLALMAQLVAPDATPKQRLRSSVAVFTLHASWFVLREQNLSDEELRKTALELALELVE